MGLTRGGAPLAGGNVGLAFGGKRYGALPELRLADVATCVATDHRCPNGSLIEHERSPQNCVVGSRSTSIPAQRRYLQ